MREDGSLNLYQKAILIFMIAMALIFAVIYPMTISKVGYRYNDAILVHTQENGTTLYTGEIEGQQACFTVSDNTVKFQYGEKIYGPYTVKDDKSAIPADHELSGVLTGIEVREGDTLLFRGGIVPVNGFYLLYNEDGTKPNFSYVTSDGIERDESGNPIDRMRPSVSTLYKLTHNPELEHKGHGLAWFGAVLICILNAVSIFFADALFRWNLAFQIRDAEDAEPSDWVIVGRYISWTAMAIAALVLFIRGLQ